MLVEELKFSKEHEWVKVEEDIATIGISQHAQEELGDIVYVELPKVGAQLNTMGEFGVVESVKSVSTLYSPVSGEVSAVNEALSQSPETVNKDPYNAGWMIKVKMKNPADLAALMDSQSYQSFIKKA